MKKLHILLVVMCLVTACVFCLSSCKSEGLDKPTGFCLDQDTLTLNWDKVPGATAYSVTVGEKVKTTKSNYYSLENLEPGEYKIQIVAVGDGMTGKDSAPAVYEFKRDSESGLLYKLINNNKEYQLAGIGGAEGDVIMEDEFRGKPVTSIAPSALANNSAITSFTVGNLVTEIPRKAFYNCNALVSITIPSNITSIGENAFQSCKSLVSVVLPDSVTEISDYCFAYCRALTSIQLGKNVTKIGDYAFSDCSALEEIDIPDKVVRIGNYAFSGCEAAVSMKMGREIEHIGDNAFYLCAQIPSVTLGEKVAYIGSSAFESCAQITEIAIPGSVREIGARAFSLCDKLTNVTVGDDGENIEAIGRNAFQDTAFLDNIEDDIAYLGKWIIICKNPEVCKDSDVTPLIKAGTVGIADFAFYGCNDFTGITLPDAKYIGDYAFYKCGNLMEIKLGVNAVRIGDYAFSGCENLVSALIGQTSLTHIGDYAFNGCKIASIKLPNTLVSLGTYAFSNTSLPVGADGVIYADNWVAGYKNFVSNITIKDGTVGIADYSFFECYMIGSVELPDSLRYIGRGAFMACAIIYIDQFPSELKRIEDYAFYACSGARFGVNYDAVLPEGLEYIGRSAFYQSNVAGMNIPGTCKYIGDYAFFGCTNLGVYLSEEETGADAIQYTLTLNDGIAHIGTRAFFNCKQLTSVEIPDSVTEMGIRVFYGCESLKSAVIGKGLKQIPDFTFFGCKSLESVKLASTTKGIGYRAFMDCAALREVDLGLSLLEIGDYAFYGCKSLEVLRLPTSLLTIGEFAIRGNIGATSMLIHSGVTKIGQHAVYGNSRVTIYCEAENAPIGWSERWNSTFRPVVFGCRLSEDKSYVVSFTKDQNSVRNDDAVNGISAPNRDGYIFSGWATEQGGEAEYSAENVMDAPDGTVLYAVWSEVQPA